MFEEAKNPFDSDGPIVQHGLYIPMPIPMPPQSSPWQTPTIITIDDDDEEIWETLHDEQHLENLTREYNCNTVIANANEAKAVRHSLFLRRQQSG